MTSLRPLLSVVIIGRNDGYMGDYLYRLATSVSFLARNAESIGLLDRLDVTIVDWASETPLARVLPLDPVARRITTFAEVPPEAVRTRFGAMPWLASTAVNVGVRRARGEYILFTDSDCLWTVPALRALERILTGDEALPAPVRETFCYIRRYQIPWATVHRQPRLDEWSRLATLLFAGVRGESPSASCLGGFSAGQLMHCDLWHTVRGYDERLERRWGWADNDLMLRVTQHHPWIDVSAYGAYGMHMEHWLDDQDRAARDPETVNPMTVHNELTVNGPGWGLGDLDVTLTRCSAAAALPVGDGCAVPLSGHTASPFWTRGPEAAAFVRRIAADYDPTVSFDDLTTVAQIALADRPTSVWWFGGIIPPVLMTILKATPAAELLLINPWPAGTSDHLPVHPGTLGSVLGASSRFSGWARIVQGDPATAVERITTSAMTPRAPELVWIGTETPAVTIAQAARVLAPGGVLLAPAHSQSSRTFEALAGDLSLPALRLKPIGGLVAATRIIHPIRSEDMPVNRQTSTAEPSEAARSLRTVLDLLLQDRTLSAVEPESLAWSEPIFVIRSAPMDRLVALLTQIVAKNAAPRLHIMSHARDEAAIRAAAPCDFTFHAYPTPGAYRLEGIPADMLERLRQLDLGTLFFLDTGTSSDLLGEVERLLAGIRENRAVSFRGDGSFARTPDWRQRTLAEAAFLRLIEWYHFKLDPGTPAAPIDDATPKSAA